MAIHVSRPIGQPASSTDRFSVAISFGPDRARLHLRGELDLAGVPVWKERFDEVCATEVTFVVFDLCELTYCDSTGLRALLQAAAGCAKDGRDMHATGAQGVVRRVIELTHTADALNLIDEN